MAVDELDGAVWVLAKGEEPTAVPIAEFDQLRVCEVPGPPVLGAAGRLWRANNARQSTGVKGSWPEYTAEVAAARFTGVTLGRRRAAAIDAIALDRPAPPGQPALTSSELDWYQACVDAAGPLSTLLDRLARLPAARYPSRVALLLRRAGDLMADREQADRARTLLEPFVEDDPDARALYMALAAEPVPFTAAFVKDFTRGLGGSPYPEALAAVGAAIADGIRPAAFPPGRAPSVRALDAWLAGMAGSGLDGAVDVLGPLSPDLLDDLVDTGALTRMPAGSTPWSPTVAGYLRCRLEPGTAPPDDLTAAGFHSELARRYFLAGADERLSALPDGPKVRHYRALHAQRTGAPHEAEDLEPVARKLVAAVARLREPGTEARDLPEVVAADPSSWALLSEAGLRGHLRLDADLRLRYPACAAWLDLCEVQRLVFDGSWPEAAAAGRALVTSGADEAVLDEARNMVAFVEWQLGRPTVAIRELEQALAGQYNAGLLVNAALVAAEVSTRSAYPHLAAMTRFAEDPQVRKGAIIRALGLWLADDTAEEYPPEVADMVRRALGAPLADDEFHRSLLLTSVFHDTAWLSDGPVAASGTDQSAALAYFRLRARAIQPERKEDFADVARMLATLWARSPRPDWVRDQRDWLRDLIDRLVHRKFGEAPGVTGMVEALVAGKLLELRDELIFTAQAGAHVAAALGNDGDALSSDVEHRLLFGPVRQYWARLTDLDTDDVEPVGEEIGRCVVMSGLAMAVFTEQVFEKVCQRWNELIAQERWDVQNRPYLRQNRVKALDLLDTWIGRCRGYLTAAERLPLSQDIQAIRDNIQKNIRDWATESRRLRNML
ncbi:hypothetical protein AB0M43_35525 [Longispora sp. NPDC051575]|uniref:hypothetical protein n=1 Tax=Longispora sp. NPDC051575 TaxID=3154943 RepID=UPI00341820C7